MQIPPPEMAALLQAGSVDTALFRLIEGHRDIQSLVAVLASQQPFDITQDNQGKLYQGHSADLLPDPVHRVRYLGYLLMQQLNLHRPLRLHLDFGWAYRHIPLMLVLKGFWITGRHRLRVVTGQVLQQPGLSDQEGCVEFALPPLADVITRPEQLTGFHVYLIRPKPEPTQLAQRSSLTARSEPALNGRRTIDVKV
jgi:hypothetical protein